MIGNHRPLYFALYTGLFCIVALYAPAARTESWAIQANVTGQTRNVQVTPVSIQGIAYIPLSALIRQLGGGCEVTAARVQADLGGKTALIGMNNTRVNTAQLQFSLAYPVVMQEGDAWIAQSDVVGFLSQAFQINPTAPATESADMAPIQAPESPEPSVDLDADTSKALATIPAVPAAPAEAPPTSPPAPAEPAPAAQPAPAPETPAPVETPDKLPQERPLRIVAIDPGHGGTDAGSVGPNGLTEKDLVLAVAKHLRRLLTEAGGLQVFLTHEKDGDQSLGDRVNAANQKKADVLISLHAGISYATQAHGFEIFCANGASESAAPQTRAIANAMVQSLGAATGAESRGIRETPLRVTRDLAMPGLLVEIGMLSNPAEESALATEAYQIKIAEGLAQSLKPFLAKPAAVEGKQP